MNPCERACAQLLERQERRNTLHLNFGSAMKSTTRDGSGNAASGNPLPTNK